MATSASAGKKMGGQIQPMIDFLSTQAKMRGWPFLAAWAHRISGVLLVLYVWFHIVTLSSLNDPARFDGKMTVFGYGLFVFLEWLLALPVIYHALNGGRLILYEVFENRRDDIVLKWVIALGILYTLLLALCMLIGNQTISAPIFWIYTMAAAGCVVTVTIEKIRTSGAAMLWKLQRISGAFLLVAVPAHMLFMHINPGMGHDAQIIIARMGNLFIKLVDIALVICVLYHGAYGIYAIGRDYFASLRAKIGMGVLLICVTLVFAWVGLKLIVLI